MTWIRRTCREDGSCVRTVVVRGEIAEQLQAVSRQQKTRCGRCRRSTHTVKQCAVITCVALCVWVFTRRCQCEQSCRGVATSRLTAHSSYRALPDIIVGTLLPHLCVLAPLLNTLFLASLGNFPPHHKVGVNQSKLINIYRRYVNTPFTIMYHAKS